ncbi:MAG: D-serine ammonia-lyase [Kosmotogaceae bacterium]
MENKEEIIEKIKKFTSVFWKNDSVIDNPADYLENQKLKYNDIIDAENRWKRFSPLLKRFFPAIEQGIIESELKYADQLKDFLERKYHKRIKGDLLLKCDNKLPITGSIKSRGGIYEVLAFAEKLAIENAEFTGSDYRILGAKKYRKIFSNYRILVGSTGNLGLSVGIIGKKLGFRVEIHMSTDAKEWKKALLKKAGANIIEHEESYSEAVNEGRGIAKSDLKSYFVDDENSEILFLGYATAALRLKKQLEEKGITIDEANPLYVYLPCGVGGAPGGITFGLKHIFGKNVRSYFAEPVKAPAMFLGVLTGECELIDVRDFGIDGKTIADGLAVSKPSKLSCNMMKYLADGFYTVEDSTMEYLSMVVKNVVNEKIEPSAAAGITGPLQTSEQCNIKEKATHIVWLTGGSMIPEDVYKDMFQKWKKFEK